MISVIDGVNERVLRIMLLKNGKEVSSLSWINVLSFIHKIYLRNKETQQILWVTKNMLCNTSLWYN